jgi:hypothetical protein
MKVNEIKWKQMNVNESKWKLFVTWNLHERSMKEWTFMKVHELSDFTVMNVRSSIFFFSFFSFSFN